MNTYADHKHNISDVERAAFRNALTIYYGGSGPITDAFAQVEPGLIDRYYRRRKAYPDEMEEIEREARAAARRERSGDHLAFEARQERVSWEQRERATAILVENLEALYRIAIGKPRVVEMVDGDGEITRKTVVPYPRDQIAAFKTLLDVARYGVLPSNWRSSLDYPGEADADERKGSLMPIFSASSAFKRVEAMAPDGTKISMTLDDLEDADGGGDSA